MSMFGSRYFYDVSVNAQVLILAREIRDYYYKEGDPDAGVNYRMMSLGDAIHLATAITEGVSSFHTRDGNKRGGNVPLLGLAEGSANGKIAGKWSLVIESPEERKVISSTSPKKPAEMQSHPDNPAQYKRFLEVAREVGADEEASDFDAVLRRVADPTQKPLVKPKAMRGADAAKRKK